MRSSVPISPSSGSAWIRKLITRLRSKRFRPIVDGYPGLLRDLLTFLRERIEEVFTGASGGVVVRIFGPDLDS